MSKPHIFRAVHFLVSTHDLAVLTTVLDTWISYIIDVLALVNTGIEIVVLYKLGYKDTTSITMTGIALWDLLKLSSAMVIKCYGPMGLVSPALGKSCENIKFPTITFHQYLLSNVAHVMVGYLAIERCFCVSIPFKVKTIVTPKSTVIILLGISITVFVSLMPMIFEFVWIFSEEYNTTIAIYQYSSFYYQHGDDFLSSYKFCSFLYPSMSLLSMVISTAIIVYRLYKASSFRAKCVAKMQAFGRGKREPEMATRYKQTVKMLIVVIVIYIFCLVPRCTQFVVMLLVPECYYRISQYLLGRCLHKHLPGLHEFCESLLCDLSMRTNFRHTFKRTFLGFTGERQHSSFS